MTTITRYYETVSRGKAPRGRGEWQFVLETHYRERNLHCTLSPESYAKLIFTSAPGTTYSAAKKAAAKHFGEGSAVVVLPW